MTDESTARRKFCVSCGTAAGPGRFCTVCGADLGQPAPAPAAVEPAPPVQPRTAETVSDAIWTSPDPWNEGPDRGRRRGGTVLVAVLAVALVIGLAAAGGWWVLGRDASPDDAGATADQSASPAPTAETTPPETAPPTTATPAAARCWDGSTAAAVSSCPAGPDGVKGLEWVFPGLDRAACPRSSADRELLMQCRADARGVRLNFSQYASFQAAKSHYDALTGDDAASAISGNRLAWYSDGVYRDGEFKGAIVYDGEPFAVSVYAPTAALRDEAMSSLRMRPRALLRGVRAGS